MFDLSEEWMPIGKGIYRQRANPMNSPKESS